MNENKDYSPSIESSDVKDRASELWVEDYQKLWDRLQHSNERIFAFADKMWVESQEFSQDLNIWIDNPFQQERKNLSQEFDISFVTPIDAIKDRLTRQWKPINPPAQNW